MIGRFRLSNGVVEAVVTDFGACLQSLKAPDRDGNVAECTLCFESDEDLRVNKQYMGSTVGRVCNRIGGASYTVEGVTCKLEANNGPNSIHGGLRGWSHMRWDFDEKSVVRDDSDRLRQVAFSLMAPSMEGGHFGALRARVQYNLSDDHTLRILQGAELLEGTPWAVVNICNHAYFNLSGDPGRTVLDHTLTVNASGYLPLDENKVPTGEVASVEETALDFRQPALLGQRVIRANGLDNCLVPEGDGFLREVAVLEHAPTGRRLRVFSDKPGVQVYAGEAVPPLCLKEGLFVSRHCGVCLETQAFPDAPNKPEWLPQVLLKRNAEGKGGTVTYITEFKLETFA
uniref:Aldose 1-epimerase n=1 Tax=Chromera velia CCMP2878 TaxID=1169474 RepID=A0A0G4HZ17_9ALVE|mmetsp:Transcript_16254/g.32937  ORF Transcript_16254/g.32937 Transcript_16254/m.32937 type:complete len:343 (-) Transcript_16254:21-1049(-)|eukprot:Cvel_1560.t1-p1 / transcript=Cvel_1560.t1 / gene=Cvel_1560 / organism=Chromera_velia_CCMP2878 / gene_product=Aldose 1-epimerase, putative / transcript_product=Aldose 1-epimerase, putative / location=Cvel_scaffold55:91153-94528(-) / protein_length=342 / sequence_SO=supercontig / SO=protein_coding / is_pseudo=false